MMKETNIQPQVTSTIAGDDGEAVGNSEENAKKMASKKPNEWLKNLMMYELSHCSTFADELQEAERTGTRESAFIKNASSAKFDFRKDVLLKLMNCKSRYTLEKHISKLLKNKLIALDDYSFTFKTL